MYATVDNQFKKSKAPEETCYSHELILLCHEQCDWRLTFPSQVKSFLIQTQTDKTKLKRDIIGCTHTNTSLSSH